MVSDKNADILFFKFVDNFLNVFHSDRVNAGKRFIKHYELWIDCKASRNLRASAFAARQLVAKVFPDLLKPEFRNQAFQFLLLIFGSGRRHLQDSADVVFYAKLAKHRRLLGKIPDSELSSLINRKAGYVLIVKKNFPSLGAIRPVVI